MNTENNKIITEFLNSKVTVDTYFINGMYMTINETDLKFHSDWNWLMEVVHKCLLICHNDMLNEWEAGFSDSFFSMDINCVYSEVVRFIKWYNEQK